MGVVEGLFIKSEKIYLEKNNLTKFEQRGEFEGRRVFKFNYERSS